MKISIAGSYISKFGELFEKSLTDLIEEAVVGVLKNSKVNSKKIDAVFVANKAGGSFNQQRHLNALVSQQFSHFPPAFRIEGACASGALAMVAAEQGLASGRYETVLVIGVEKMTDLSAAETTEVLATAASREKEYASTFPGLYALMANYHMHKYGTTREELSAVVVKNHQHAFANPNAQFHRNFSLETVSTSALVADPLRLLDCSPISDGVAAVILTKKALKKKARVIAYGHAQDTLALADRTDLGQLLASKKAAMEAYERSGLSPKDIDAVEVHDCFSIAEIMALEDLGFFEKGKAASAGLNQETTYGGKIVVNPSGGLKACGHPVGATGVKQIAYLSQLLERGDFKKVLAHNVGGSGATAVVHILGI